MAEFADIARKWRRMCDYYTRKSMEDVHSSGCISLCPLGHNDACGDIKAAEDGDIEAAEATIIAWDKEHPEPVYPTWGEWLEKQGIVKLVNSERYDEDYQKVLILLDSVENPIPADMAEKLGIEPKEE